MQREADAGSWCDDGQGWVMGRVTDVMRLLEQLWRVVDTAGTTAVAAADEDGW